MEKTKVKKQQLGIFYTPLDVVNFIYEIFHIWKEKEDQKNKRWLKHNPPHYPSIIDPAVGEGIFLKTAIEKGFTKKQYIFGIDIDPEVVKRWPEINLLETFHQNMTELQAHFFHQNGLDTLDWTKHKKHYQSFLKKTDIKNQQFDCVVGNPPYGGIGLEEKDLSDSLIDNLVNFELLPADVKKNVGLAKSMAGGLFHEDKKNAIGEKQLKRLNSFPIEILFLERFIQLAKPGGWIAIIIPDGILTNSNYHYVRKFITNKTKIEAIISLPRETFKNAGTNAKTSILLLRKYKKNEILSDSYSVFLAFVEKIGTYQFNSIVKSYEKFYNLGETHMNKLDSVQTTKDQDGNEVLMIRIDKTVKEMMEEKPFSRLDANYWHPKWDKVIQEFKQSKFKIKYLFEFFKIDDWLISTDHVRASKGESEGPDLPVEYYSPAGFLFTGYRTCSIPRCSQNAFKRMQRARPLKNDILLGGFGMGPTGKSLVLWHSPADKAIVGNIFILRVKGFYNPYVLDVFFKSKYGQAQFNKYKTGVAFNSLSNDEIKYLLVPDFSTNLIDAIEKKYKEIIEVHDQAMEEYKKGDKNQYKVYLEKAEKMLKETIQKTEDVIQGKREDVN